MKLTNAADDRDDGSDRTESSAPIEGGLPPIAKPAVRVFAPIAPELARLAAEYYLEKQRTDVVVREAERRSETLQHLQDAEVTEPAGRSRRPTGPPETTSQPSDRIQQLLDREVCQTCRMALEHAQGLPPGEQRDVLDAYEAYKSAEVDYEQGRLSRAEMEQVTDRLLDSAGL